jgi:hypothetical protein
MSQLEEGECPEPNGVLQESTPPPSEEANGAELNGESKESPEVVPETNGVEEGEADPVANAEGGGAQENDDSPEIVNDVNIEPGAELGTKSEDSKEQETPPKQSPDVEEGEEKDAEVDTAEPEAANGDDGRVDLGEDREGTPTLDEKLPTTGLEGLETEPISEEEEREAEEGEIIGEEKVEIAWKKPSNRRNYRDKKAKPEEEEPEAPAKQRPTEEKKREPRRKDRKKQSNNSNVSVTKK